MKESMIYDGIFRKNAKGFGFVKIDEFEDEVYVTLENSLSSINGDFVKVKIIKEKVNGQSAEGQIIKILKHKKDTVVGIFQNNKSFGFVVPDDKTLGTDIFISKKNFGKARNNHKVVVKILKYPDKGKNAEGKVIEVIGNINEAGVDMLSLIKEYNLPAKFHKAVKQEAKSKGNNIDEQDIENRIDSINYIDTNNKESSIIARLFK